MFKRKNKQEPRKSISDKQSAKPYSYYTSRYRSDQPTGRQIEDLDEHSSYKWWHHLPTVVAFIALLASAVYVLSLSMNPKVVLMSDSGGQYLLRDAKVYQKVSSEKLSGSLLNRTKITIDTNQIAESLKKRFPEIDKVTITIPLTSRRPLIEIVAIRPALIFVSGNNSFVVAEDGRAVIKTTDVAKKSNLTIPTVIDRGSLPAEVGETVMPSATVKFISEVVGQLKAKKINQSEIELPAIANELHVKIANQPYYIKFNLAGQAREQVGAYLAVRQKFEAEKRLPTEYIDVRVEERVYYK